MSIFKRKYASTKGKQKTTDKFTVEFRDHEDVIRRVTAFTDRAASLELERQLKRLVSLRMADMALTPELSRFLESLPMETLDRLGKWGIIDQERVAAGRKLECHIEDWAKSLGARQCSKRHSAETVARVRRIFAGCQIVHWADIRAEKIESWLAQSRTKGMSNRTSNSYLTSAKAFCAWMNRTGFASSNPLTLLAKLNEAVDVRVERRALNSEEICRLIGGTKASTKKLWKVSGADRAMIYLVAVGSGLRWSELRSLTRSSFDLEQNPATVTVQADAAKNRKDATIPLSDEISAKVSEYFLANPGLPLDAALRLPVSDRGAALMRHDLKEAGIAYMDELGRVADFHALRHTYITGLAKAGVHPRVAQTLARHSSIELTMKRYTHVNLESQVEALAKVPAIFPVVDKTEMKRPG